MRATLKDKIAIPRWTIAFGYLFVALIGLAAFNATFPPPPDDPAPDWWTPTWASGVAVFSILCAIGVFVGTKRAHTFERWSNVLLLALFIGYPLAVIPPGLATSDEDAVLFGTIALGVAWSLSIRTIGLIASAGKREIHA